ncbi:hypothetical protein [Chitinilyticum aquatile]|uniref:hypothetical protein n=1 Tax=Chitinilyticum aquatile TaxID=362520 RepID=UPI000425C711|nr:hypothetical protein [Chitinilyticum aquatile]
MLHILAHDGVLRWARLLDEIVVADGIASDWAALPPDSERVLHQPMLVLPLALPPHKPAQRATLLNNALLAQGITAVPLGVVEAAGRHCVCLPAPGFGIDAPAALPSTDVPPADLPRVPLGATLLAGEACRVGAQLILCRAPGEWGVVQAADDLPLPPAYQSQDWAATLARPHWHDWLLPASSAASHRTPRQPFPWRVLALWCLLLCAALAVLEGCAWLRASLAAREARATAMALVQARQPGVTVSDPVLQLRAKQGWLPEGMALLAKLNQGLPANTQIEKLEAGTDRLILQLAAPLAPADEQTLRQTLGEPYQSSPLRWEWRAAR